MSARDLRTVLDVAGELGGTRDAAGFQVGLLERLGRLVDYDIASWNMLWPESGRAAISAVDPTECRVDGDDEILAAYVHQNPLIGAPARSVTKFSDFLTARELHRLEIYDAVYRPLGVERQMAFTLPAPHGTIIGVALSRGGRDFDERDRALLELIAPFVANAHERVTELEATRSMLAAVARAADDGGRAVIVLRADGVVEHLTPAAAELIGGVDARTPRALPNPLAGWAAAHRSREGPSTDLRHDAWTARYLRGEASGYDVIVLEPRHALDPDALDTAGVGRRERQILTLVASGATNAQIAHELHISERTVAKHLEHVYAKLGVTNRTAAVAATRSLAAP